MDGTIEGKDVYQIARKLNSRVRCSARKPMRALRAAALH
jgi:hypothetical protein